MLRNVLTNCVITKTHPNIGSMIMREKSITSIQEAAWLEKGSWKEISKREHPMVSIFFSYFAFIIENLRILVGFLDLEQ